MRKPGKEHLSRISLCRLEKVPINVFCNNVYVYINEKKTVLIQKKLRNDVDI